MNSITVLLGKIATLIINPVIVLGFVIATVFFFYSVIKLISGADGSDLAKRRQGVIWGVVGLVIMFSVYGILRLVLATFGIEYPGFFN